jgi:hypothetical protein
VEGTNIMNLAKYIKFPLGSILLLASTSCQPTIATVSSNQTTLTYESSSENFPNPERGFFVAVDPMGNNPVSPLQVSDLQKVKSQNMTLVRRIYLLSEFREKPLSESFLEMISQDCETARQAGVKLIVRFSYNWLGGGADAPRERIVSHLEQLQPILAENYDAIAYMDAGFVGYWGEWHSSTNKLVDSWTLDVTHDARAIFLKILSVLPTERMVTIRYPKQKKQIFNNINTLSIEEAFNGSVRARTGHHNDGFRSGIDDAGTYGSTNPTIIEQEKTWLNLDTQYVVQGGEPAWPSNPPEYDCPGVLTDLARMHWSSLSTNQPDATEIYQGWIKQGCMEEIKRRLGYRFRVVNSKVSKIVKPNGTFAMSFEIINEGWASPYNRRQVEVVLRNRETKREYHWVVNADPRLWMAGTTKLINFAETIPADTPYGEYDVLLNLPDPTPKLYKRPEYSIRLANPDIWEAPTGYNSLLQSIIVAPM